MDEEVMARVVNALAHVDPWQVAQGLKKEVALLEWRKRQVENFLIEVKIRAEQLSGEPWDKMYKLKEAK